MPDDRPVLYEMLYIIDPGLGDDGIEKAQENLKNEITALGGTIEKENPWGQRRLAYPIKKRTEGFYVVLEFNLSPSKHTQLTTDLRISQEILRFLSIRVPKAKLLQDEHDAKVMKKRAAEAEKAREAAAARAEAQAKAEAEAQAKAAEAAGETETQAAETVATTETDAASPESTAAPEETEGSATVEEPAAATQEESPSQPEPTPAPDSPEPEAPAAEEETPA